MPYVLLSPVGDTDPIRNGYDGPLLHIARQYKPEAVFMFLTAEMTRREEKRGCYSKAIRHILPDCVIDITRSDIENAHDFDAFQPHFDRLISRIVSDYPGAEILVNITSATPQIQSALALEVVTNAARLKAVQVSTPAKKSNADTPHFNAGTDDIDEAMENNLDSLPEAENRCAEPNILSFRKVMLKRQIAALIGSYDYSGAFGLLKGEDRALFGDRTRELIKHAYYRSRPDSENAEKSAKKLDMLDKLYPVTTARNKKVFEYFLITDLKFRRHEYANYYVRVMNMADYMLGSFCGVSRYDKWYELLDTAREKNTALADRFDKVYGKKEGFPNEKGAYEYRDRRNDAAHTLLEADDPTNAYHEYVKELMLKYYSPVVPESVVKRTLGIYDEINRLIIDSMG
ncbi:hypothetical protein FACS1894216_11170 [Synergistales bacterium]|nr:hypothetical protein FACS1894216_11170 [Synergistales bacterium]